MSIYSGFGMRKMEEQYNKLVSRLILLLQSDFMQLMSPHLKHKNTQYSIEIHRKKKLQDYKLVLDKLQLFQQHKYLEPKFSQLCVPLKNYIRHTDSIMMINSPNIQRKVNSQKKDTRNEHFQQVKQKINIHTNITHSNISSQNFNSIETSNQTMTQFRKQFQSKFQQFTHKNIKTKNENVKDEFSIFTIQEVSENVSRKQSLKKNNKLIQIPNLNFIQKSKQKTVRIYRSNEKYTSPSKSQKGTKESFFPSYRKFSFSKKIQKDQIKNWSFDDIRNQNDCEVNQVQTSQFQSLPNETLNLEMSQSFVQTHAQTFHKIKSNITTRAKPVKKVQKSTYFINMRYKKLIDRSDLQKLLLKKTQVDTIKNKTNL